MEAIGNLREETQNRDTDIEQLIEELRVEDDKPHAQPVVLDQGKQVAKTSLSILIEDLVVGTMAL